MNITRARVTRACRRAAATARGFGRFDRAWLGARHLGSSGHSARRRAGRVSGTRTTATTALTAATRGGQEERHVRPAERRQPSDGRAEHEPDAEGRAEQAEQAGPLGRGRQVGDRALGDRHAGPGGAVDDPAEEQQPQRPGQAGEEAADGRADQRQDDHGLAPDAVGQPAEQRRADQLGGRERGEEEPDGRGRGAEPLGVEARGSARRCRSRRGRARPSSRSARSRRAAVDAARRWRWRPRESRGHRRRTVVPCFVVSTTQPASVSSARRASAAA